MLISPPFLPVADGVLNEDEWLDLAMPVPQSGEGAFPVSFNLGWHGGVHLTAPMNGSSSESVRAISDGTVIYRRSPTHKTSDERHPLNYRGGWTDDGCVVIRHETSIGHGENAAKIIFFSIYMHLSEVSHAIKGGQRVCRKDALGQAGQIYGDLERTIHFEIVCDATNMIKLFGRSTGDLEVSKDGRADSVYGEIYFHLPVGTKIFATKPLSDRAIAYSQPPKHNRSSPKPAPVELKEVYTTDSAIIVGMRYTTRTISYADLGDAIVSTYLLDGAIIGKPLKEIHAEYNIYSEAVRISDSFELKSRPAPSAVFEILRFGRIINISQETLLPDGVPHWRLINYPGGTGWVNLNGTEIRKFSDADFPHWKSWNVVDDSEDRDCRCDSQIIKELTVRGRAKNADAVIETQLQTWEGAQKMLSRSICKFPSEWVSESIDKRWSWLTQESQSDGMPMTSEDYDELKRHIGALCIDEPLLHEALWHWSPIEFIRHFRACGWLSERELIRCVPAAYQCEQGQKGTNRTIARINLDVAKLRVAKRDPIIFMRICRKYGLDSPNRLAHFLAQIFRETGVLNWNQELASGEEYEGRRGLGNDKPGDGVRFKGRGLIQTTGFTNYEKYSRYRGKSGATSYVVEPNNLQLATDPYCCVDTAALYWVSRDVGPGLNINRICDLGQSEERLRSVTRNVNGSADGTQTGLFERRSHLRLLVAVLLDHIEVMFPETERKNV